MLFMIKINLLREKKAKKRGSAKGQESLLVGMIGCAAAAVAVFFFIHAPLADEIDRMRTENAKIQKNVKKLTEETKEFDSVQKQVSMLEEQEAAIARLQGARAVPAWMLHELSNVLTKDRRPTMSSEMADRVKLDANRQFTPGWDPKRVWIESFTEKNGAFTMVGGAQSDMDVTQLALRLQASAYFSDVQPEGGSEAEDKDTKLAYYRFTITGRVVY